MISGSRESWRERAKSNAVKPSWKERKSLNENRGRGADEEGEQSQCAQDNQTITKSGTKRGEANWERNETAVIKGFAELADKYRLELSDVKC